MTNTIEQFNEMLLEQIEQDKLSTLTNNRNVIRDADNKVLTVKNGYDKIMSLINKATR